MKILPTPFGASDIRSDFVYSVLLHAALLLALPYLTVKAPTRFVEVSLSAEISTVPQNLKRSPRSAQPAEQKVRTWTPGEGEPVQAALSTEQSISVPTPEIRDDSRPDISTFEDKPRIEAPLPEKMLPFFEGKEGQSFQISGPISRRAVLRRVYPEYPRSAQMAGISGETTVKFWVSSDGIIERVIIEKTSGSEELDRSALDTVKKWLFAPLGADEEQIDQWGILSVRFELK